jgi:hypothetical protein
MTKKNRQNIYFVLPEEQSYSDVCVCVCVSAGVVEHCEFSKTYFDSCDLSLRNLINHTNQIEFFIDIILPAALWPWG